MSHAITGSISPHEVMAHIHKQKQATMIIAQICDTHISLPQPEASDRLRDLEMAVEEINALVALPDVVVHAGDIAHEGKLEEYRAAKDIISQLKMPVFAIPGNKDRRGPMEQVFCGQIGPRLCTDYIQYAVDDFPVRLIMLDTLDENGRLGMLCKSRLENFQTLLEQDRDKSTLVFMHHPMFEIPEAPRSFQFDSRQTVERFIEILNQYPQVTNIYCGHAHRYGSGMIGKVPGRCIPSIAVDLRFGEYPEKYRSKPIFEIYQH
ncbi:MAG: metallophosphoesterase [Rhizobiaceae bacterium]|nr:metallophosphoesterase [Rhizobiaceae bacterium]